MNTGGMDATKSSGASRRGSGAGIRVKLDKLQKLRWFGLLRDLGLLTVVFFVNRAGVAGNAVAYGLLILLAWTSPLNALKALTISGLILTGNPGLIGTSVAVSVGKFALIGVAAARVWSEVFFRRRNLLAQPHLKALMAFCAIAAALTPINGYFVGVSFLKLAVFMVGSATLLALPELKLARTRDLLGWFTSVLVFIVAVSLLTIPLGISRATQYGLVPINKSGLSGVTNQPQALGGMLVLLAIVSLGIFSFTKLRQRVYFLGIFIALLPLLVMTQSRTALFSVAGTFAITVLLSPAVVSRARGAFRNFTLALFFRFGLSLFALVLIGSLFAKQSVGNSIREFIAKGRRDSSEVVKLDDIGQDRMTLIAESWETFLERPLTGINFGTSRNPWFVETASLLSAPTEKGLIVTGVLEEVGLIGSVAFLVFIGLLVRHFWLKGNIVGLSAFIGILLINFGEMNFFSFGGAGLILWSVVALAMAIGQGCSNDVLGARKPRRVLAGRAARGRTASRSEGEKALAGTRAGLTESGVNLLKGGAGVPSEIKRITPPRLRPSGGSKSSLGLGSGRPTHQ